MTRFARVNRTRRGEKFKATPWSLLSKVCKPENISVQKEEVSVNQHASKVEVIKKSRKSKLLKEPNKIMTNESRHSQCDTEKTASIKLKKNDVPKKETVVSRKKKKKTDTRSFQDSTKYGTVEVPTSSSNNKDAFDEITQKLNSCDQTLEDVKKLVTDYVRKGFVTRADAGKVVKRWKDSEKRRIGRQISKLTKAACFLCRQSGHLYSECPERDESKMGVGICYKCGSSEHGSAKCPRKNVIGYPYAFCFICKRQGHISRECEQNANGIYPDGGSCNLCGCQDHLKRDCPNLNLRKSSKKNKETLAVIGNDMIGGDEEVLAPEFDASFKRGKLKSKEKMIHF